MMRHALRLNALAMLVMMLAAMPFAIVPGLSVAQEADGTAVAAAREQRYQVYRDLPDHIIGADIDAHWLADGNRFWFTRHAADKIEALLVDPATDRATDFFDTARLRAALTNMLGHEPLYQGVPFETFTLEDGAFEDHGSTALFTLEQNTYRLDLDSYALQRVAPEVPRLTDRKTPRRVRESFPETDPDIYEMLSPDGQWFLGERDYNLYIRSTTDGRIVPLTEEGDKDFPWEMAGGRNNIAIGEARWSPDSRQVLVFRSDNKGVAWFPITHWLKPTEEVEWQRFTKAGQALPQTGLYAIDITSKARTTLETGDEPDQWSHRRPADPGWESKRSLLDQKGRALNYMQSSEAAFRHRREQGSETHYYHPIGWLPDGSEVLFLRLNRVFQRLDVMAADSSTGVSRIILTEKQPTFIKGIASNPGWTDLFSLLPRSGQFLWTSERDGWDHLYLYDLDGKLVRRLTSGNWPVLQVVGVDEQNGWVYFTGHAEERVYDTHVYRVGLNGKGFKRLTEAEGQHTAEFSPSMQYFIDRHSSITRPPVADLRTADGTWLRTLAQADISQLEAVGWSPPEEFVVKAADGVTDLWGVMFKPFDFDPNQRYPVVDFLYNGPQTTVAQRAFTLSWQHYAPHALAQLGFIVFSVDGRGTTERGKAFQDVVYQNFGRNEIPDHVATLKQLGAARPYMDIDRVGLYGGSWGGYMTIRGMLQAPEIYKAGVATYPVADLYHWASAIEPYMGTPQQNRAAYEYGSSLRLVDQLQGHLMLVHGTSDVNAHFGATVQMVEALTRAGKPYDLVLLPEANHSLKGTDKKYWQNAIRRHFQEHLQNAPSTNTR